MADGTGAGSSLVERAKNILIEPNAEWDRIEAEPMTVASIFTGWVFILAAIPAVASLVGMLLFGRVTTIVGTIGIPISVIISTAITLYIFTTSGIFLYGLLIDALAPTFNGTQNRVQAMKVAAFATTPIFLAGIFGLLPQLAAILTLIGGAYALYLLYLGLPKLMKTPEDKAIPYVIAVIVAGIVIGAIAGVLIATLSGLFAPSAPVPYVIS